MEPTLLSGLIGLFVMNLADMTFNSNQADLPIYPVGSSADLNGMKLLIAVNVY